MSEHSAHASTARPVRKLSALILTILAATGCKEMPPTTLAGPEPTPPAAPSPPAAPEPPSVPDQPPLPGSLEVTIETIGDDLDPDGYSLVIDGGSGTTTSRNDQIGPLGPLTVGLHAIELVDVASNCRVTNVSNPTAINVAPGRTTRLSLVVFCLRPDAGRIYYQKGSSPGAAFSMPSIGGDRTLVIPVLEYFSVSRDGDRIVYTQPTTDGPRLFVQNADGSNPVLVTNEVEPGSRPDLSPDGSRIVFAERGGGGDVFAINVDGSGLTNLTNGEIDPGFPKADPAWSPDGTKIVFTSLPPENGPLYVMNSDGTGLAQLTNPQTEIDHVKAAWSPDGGGIVLVEYSFFSTLPRQLVVIQADGTGRRLLGVEAVPESASWSPDGRWLVFGGGGDIHLMRADGTDPVRLPSPFDGNFAPQWR